MVPEQKQETNAEILSRLVEQARQAVAASSKAQPSEQWDVGGTSPAAGVECSCDGSQNEPKEIMKPCIHAWQVKWLGLDCYHDQIQEMADRVQKFCGRWFRNNPYPGMMVIAGDPNCGKTHVAKKIHAWAMQVGMKAYEDGYWKKGIPDSLYISWPEVADSFKQGYYLSVEDMMDASLLILDDLGAEHDPSKSAENKLCQILSRREFKFMVVTTNIRPQNWSTSFDARVMDRLFRNSEVIDLFGLPSYAVKNMLESSTK